MRHYITDRGIQAAATGAVLLAILGAITSEYRPVWAGLWIIWAVGAVLAVYWAHKKARS